jgi:hypothetical protein
MYPRLIPGAMIFEKDPTYITLFVSSRLKIDVGRSPSYLLSA